MSRPFALGAALLHLMIVTISAQTLQIRPRSRDWLAPASASEKVNPLANRQEVAAGGRKLFAQRCSTCHGDDGRGSERAPDLSAPDLQAQTDGALFWKITSGNTRSGMPAFSFLPEPQRWQLVLHMRGLVEGAAPVTLCGHTASLVFGQAGLRGFSRAADQGKLVGTRELLSFSRRIPWSAE